MIATILEILAEFGLIHADYKHRKKVNRMEKEDGIKRPFRKYMLQPSTILIISFLVIGSLSAVLFFSYYRTSIFPKKTKTELIEISNSLDSWKNEFGTFPSELNKIVNGRPLRQEWLNDAWNRPYKYSVDQNKNSFLIKSAGPDGIFDNSDDITSE